MVEAGPGAVLAPAGEARSRGRADEAPDAGLERVAAAACRAALLPLGARPDLLDRYATCRAALALAAEAGADPALVAAVGYAGAGWRLQARSRGGCCAGPMQLAPRHHCPDGAGGRGGPRWYRWTWHPTRPGVAVSRDGLTCDVLRESVARLAEVAAEELTDEDTCGRWSGGPAWREDVKRRRRARWMAAEVRRVRRAVQRAAAGGPEA